VDQKSKLIESGIKHHKTNRTKPI